MNKRAGFITITLLLTVIFTSGFSQINEEEKSIKEAIQGMFKGMELGDSAMVSKSLLKETTMVSISRNQNNQLVLHRDPSSKDQWLKAIGTPHNGKWFEEIWDLKIQIDGDFAQAWCNYAFYIDNKFSHCGVDAFHLTKTAQGWKVFHLADTRRKQECYMPRDIVDKHKGL
jgi:hypothetical protein